MKVICEVWGANVGRFLLGGYFLKGKGVGRFLLGEGEGKGGAGRFLLVEGEGRGKGEGKG